MPEANKVAKKAIDFTNVKEGSDIKPKRVPAGDYELKIVKVIESITKENKDTMWTFVLQPKNIKSATYPYRCILTEKSLWTLRNLLVACGKTVPKKRVSVDPEKLVGLSVGGSLEDSEYNDREQSEVTSVFPVDELDGDEPGDESDADDDAEGDEDEVSEEELDEIEID